MNRVVITGMGAISPIGNSVEEVWTNIKNHKSGIAEITNFDATDFKVKVAAEVKDFDANELFGRKEARRNDPVEHYAMAAAGQALDQSGYVIDDSNAERVGTLVGTGMGGLSAIIDGTSRYVNKGPDRVPVLFVPKAIANMVSGSVSIKYGAKGDSFTPVTACATGTHSIGEGYLKIKHGYLDAAFVGGADDTVNGLAVAAFQNLTALSQNPDPETACRPFDKDRDGFVAGEGGAVLFLESLESAQKRGATILAEVVGYGSTSDAYHITAPDPEGTQNVRAIKNAMEMAGLEPKDLDYINAHGTSTPTNDVTETMIYKKALGEEAYNVPISSTKSYTGHMLGAAGAIEALITVQALKDGYIPATLGLKETSEDMDLDYVPGQGREADIQYALSNSLGFGGHNATLIFKKWEG